MLFFGSSPEELLIFVFFPLRVPVKVLQFSLKLPVLCLPLSTLWRGEKGNEVFIPARDEVLKIPDQKRY